MEFLLKFNDVTKKVWKMAKEVGHEKLQKSDGVNRTKLVATIFSKLAQKKPSAAENGVLTWNIYGHEFAIKTTQDNFMDDSLIYEETRSVFPYLAQVKDEKY
jgi:hypothetical protein